MNQEKIDAALGRVQTYIEAVIDPALMTKEEAQELLDDISMWALETAILMDRKPRR